MPTTHVPSVSLALGQLRFGVLLCCWLIGLSIFAQIVIWTIASFTDLRYEEIPTNSQPPLVVEAESTPRASTIRSPLEAVPVEDDDARMPVDPNRVTGRFDRFLQVASQLASGGGTLAALVLLPLMALGVLLAASSATLGVEKTVSAFGWALVVGLLVLPIGSAPAMPWGGGGLWTYENLSAALDARATAAAENTESSGNLIFFGRYLLLPLACIVGITLVALRYSAGVRAGLVRREDLRVDPTLEREAANMRPGTLYGGRAANAMRQTVPHLAPTHDQTPASPPVALPPPVAVPQAPPPVVQPGEQPMHMPPQQSAPPKRLI